MGCAFSWIALLCALWACRVSGQVPQKPPSFPETFRAEVEADIISDNSESDVSLYFDRQNNRAAVHIRIQGDMFYQIFLFDEDAYVSIQGTDCDVAKIKGNPEALLFPYTINESTGMPKLLPAKEFFSFYPESADARRDAFDGVPVYVYKKNMDIPRYGRKSCTIKHIFTERAFTTAMCGDDRCNSTLMSISLECPADKDNDSPLNHTYRFFKFRNYIEDYSVFKVPPGVTCKAISPAYNKAFPELPRYFSFFYDVTERTLDVEDIPNSIRRNSKSIRYDGNERIFEVDHYKNGVLSLRKVCDQRNGVGYMIDQDSMCNREQFDSQFSYYAISQLPNILFACDNCTKRDKELPSYVGSRFHDSMMYEVWSATEDLDSTLRAVRDIYFVQSSMDNDGVVSATDGYRLSHVFEYVYSKDSTTNYKLMKKTSIFLRDLDFSRDWGAFDVTPCFDEPKQRKEFQIEFTDLPRTTSNLTCSTFYKTFTDALYVKLLSAANISSLRLPKLKLQCMTKPLTFRGVILEKMETTAVQNLPIEETGMTEAFSRIEKLANKNEFRLAVNTENGNITFKATYFGIRRNLTDTVPDDRILYTVEAMAGLGVTMALIGALIGSVAFYVYAKSKSV